MTDKLFYISGIRHNAVVITETGEDAVKLAIEADKKDKKEERVLFGSVGEWEIPEFYELKLPENYRIERKI